MHDSMSARDERIAGLRRDGSRPVLAGVSFLAAFLFVAVPFAIQDCSVVVAAPCIIACFSCSMLILRLLVGDLGVVKWLMLGMAVWLGVSVGPQWYVVALLTCGTVLCLFVIDRLIGEFVPLVDVSKHGRDSRLAYGRVDGGVEEY